MRESAQLHAHVHDVRALNERMNTYSYRHSTLRSAATLNLTVAVPCIAGDCTGHRDDGRTAVLWLLSYSLLAARHTTRY